jgi:hypothetical protein
VLRRNGGVWAVQKPRFFIELGASAGACRPAAKALFLSDFRI